MSNTQKQALIAEVVALLQTRLAEMEQPQPTASQQSQIPEMLTIKQCAETIYGLSEHTIRLLIKQGRLPHIRTGTGQNGKILVSKAALLAHFNGGTTV